MFNAFLQLPCKAKARSRRGRRIPSVYYTSVDRSVTIKVTLEGKRLREEERESTELVQHYVYRGAHIGGMSPPAV